MALEEVKTLDAEKVYRITSETNSDNVRENDLSEIAGYYLGKKSVENELNPAKPSTIHYFLSDGKVTQLLTGEILLDQSAVRAAKVIGAVSSILAYVYFPVGISDFVDKVKAATGPFLFCHQASSK